MKKNFSLIVCFVTVLALLFCSCGSAGNGKIMTSYPFICTAHISYGELQASGLLTMRNSAGGTLEILSPEQAKGLVFEMTDGAVSAHLGSTSYKFSDVSDSAVSAAELIFFSFSTVIGSPDSEAFSKRGRVCVSKTAASHSFQMYFNKKSGAPESLVFSEPDFSVEFDNFQIIT